MKIAVRLSVLMSLVLALALPASAAAQAETSKEKFSDSFPFRFFNPCTGEFVSGVVDVRGTIHETLDGSGGLHGHFHEVFNGRAVGETSGITYVGPQTDHDSFVAGSNGGFEETFTLNFRFLSQGKADNIQTHILFHVRVTPNGDVATEFEIIRDECRG